MLPLTSALATIFRKCFAKQMIKYYISRLSIHLLSSYRDFKSAKKLIGCQLDIYFRTCSDICISFASK